MLQLKDTKHYYESYQWRGKHYLFGYPPDTFPEFRWIRNLESRFEYIMGNQELLDTEAPLHLIREMLKWGSSKKRDISPKFDDYIGSYCLSTKLKKVIASLGNVRYAIESARDIPGLGPTYATKLLRFFDPNNYGALDDQIKTALEDKIKEKVRENNGAVSNSNDQYIAYIQILKEHQRMLSESAQSISMSISEIEMAFFQWAVETNKKSNKPILPMQ